MLHSQDRTTNSVSPRRTVTRAALVFGLVVLSALAIVSIAVSSRSVGAAPDRARSATSDRAERGNFRVRMHAAKETEMKPVSPAAALLPITVDRTDDNASLAASLCTAAANDCSLRGAVTFANLVPLTTINVPAGTYQLTIPGGFVEGFNGDNSIGDLDITMNNTTIAGAGAATTIIQQTQPNDRVIEVNPFLDAAFTATISDVTITGGRETTAVGGGGIISGSIDNSLTVTNCVISGNSATGAGTLGGGGISHAGGSLTVTGTTFSGNSTTTSGGGVSYSAGDPLSRTPSSGTLSVSGSSFSGNVANSVAAGGGALDLFDFNLSASTYNVNSSSFSANSAPTANGGAIIVESGPLTVTTSSFTGNSAGNSGGAVFSSGSASITYSRLVGNTVPVPTNGLTLFRSSVIFTANDNWWGSNTGPSANDFRAIGGSISPASFLQLRISASPNEICTGETSTLTADIKQRNTGAALTTELNGLPAFPVPPATIFNNAVLGTLSGASTQFVDGVATATYTAGGTAGSGSADATADNQTVTATIIVKTTQTTDPADQAVCQGTNADFSTTASGTGPFSYAWTLDGSPFDGDNPSISVPTGSLSFGDHPVTVTVTGACGSVSQSATLTVQEPTATSDPVDQTVCQGTNANFSTTASGTGPFSYAWTVDGSPVGGDSSSVSVPTGSLTVGPHTVTVTTTGTCGSASQSATLTVQQSTATSDPVDQTVCQGTNANFSTTASGTGPFSYAWTVDGSPVGGNSPSVSVPTGSLTVGPHTVTVTTTGTCGSASQSATLNVQAPTSATMPADQTVCPGATANFSTTASGTGPFTYQWKLDGNDIAGATNSSVSINTTGLTSGNHTVQVVVSGTCGSVTKSATLTVQESTATTDPVDQTVCKGTNANFSTTASGTGPFSYAWTVDGSPVGGDSSSVSVPTGSLTVGPHTVTVTTTGTCGSASQSATLTVQANTATSDPPDQTVCQGTNANFSTTASGTGPFSYAWTVDGSPVGGNSSSVSVPTGSLSVGPHTVTVTTTGTCGSASQSATLNVQAPTSATMPADQTVCPGATANFSTTASGTGPFTYQWKLDGNNIAGATNSSVSINTTGLTSGNHTVQVVVSGTCGSVTKSATLTVRQNTSTTDPANASVCQGSTASFSTTASGTGPFSFVWKKGSTVLTTGSFGGRVTITSTSTGSTLTISNTQPGDPGSYSVETTGACNTATQTFTLAVDSSAPVIVLKPSISLWPPNHSYDTINMSALVASVTDSCDSGLGVNSVIITSVSSDETENGNGDGNTNNDIIIAANCKSVQLRSERQGGGNGRVYRINLKVTDSSGNVTTATAKVSVPKNQNGSPAVDDGPAAGYTVTSSCP